MSQQGSVYWIDVPDEGWLGERWNWTHSVGCAIATFFYIIPGLIFLVWKYTSRNRYVAKKAEAERAQNRFLEYTRCDTVVSITHLGSHPALPYNSRIIVGTRAKELVFYSLDAKLLSTVSIEKAQWDAEVRHVQSVSFGSSYTPKGSSFGTTSTTSSLNFKPDSLRLNVPFKDEIVTALFYTHNYDPLALIQWLNGVKLS